jgi:hypothetical protein
MLAQDHQQVIDAGGALDLTIAWMTRGKQIANVKSAPLAKSGGQLWYTSHCGAGHEYVM